MKCIRIRRLLPLVVSADLPLSRRRTVHSHLEKCHDCKKEYELYLLSQEKMGEWLKQDNLEWKKGEWEVVTQRAVGEGTREKSPLAPWPFKKAWAYALMAGAAFLLLLFIIQPPFLKKTSGQLSGKASKEQALLTEREEERLEQDVISMTIISQETELKIVWFFNKNFNLEVKK